MDHQPLGRIESYGISSVHTFQPYPELRTDEGAPCVGRVDMQPNFLLLADDADLLQVVEGAGSGRPERGAHLTGQK